MTGKVKRIVRYILNPLLDSAMYHDSTWIERGFVAWLDREDIRKMWDYVSEFDERHGLLPEDSDEVMHDIAESEGVNYRAADRWWSYCLYEARRPAGEKRNPPFRFIDEGHTE